MKVKFLSYKQAAAALMLCLAASCSVEDTLDVTKDIDATVAIGNGISFPLGSTDKIMLTEMIDNSNSDVLKTNEEGVFTITQSGDLSATSVSIDEVEVFISPLSTSKAYELDIQAEGFDRDIIQNKINDAEATRDFLLSLAVTEAQKEAINKNFNEKLELYNQALNQEISLGHFATNIDGTEVNYDINVEIEKAGAQHNIKNIQKVEFKEATDLTIDVQIYMEAENKDFQLIDTIYLKGVDESEKFYIEMPAFISFAEGTDYEVVTADGKTYNKLYIEGGATKINDNKEKHLIKTFKITGFDFSKNHGTDGIEVKEGKINLSENLKAHGIISANDIKLSLGDALKIDGVKLISNISMGKEVADNQYSFTLSDIYGKFDPVIDPIKIEKIDLGLGNDLDFIYDYGVTFKFANPTINLELNSELTVNATTDLALRSYNKNGQEITAECGAVTTSLNINEGKNDITLTNANYQGANLSDLLAEVPHAIKIEDLQPRIDSDKIQHLALGKKMNISGKYNIDLPLEFEEISMTYTEKFEDVLGSEPENITDYVTDIEAIVLEFEAYNTVTANFDLEITALDRYGRKLNNITATFENEESTDALIKAGKGYKSEPVLSKVKITLSATNGELEKLNDIEISFKGFGKKYTNENGNEVNIVLNENDYIILQNMSVSIEEPIIVDMN